MRESFGGVFTLNLLLVFIFIYVAFTAVSLTYGKAFRVKNKVIDFIEQNEIVSLNESYLNNKLDKLDAIVANTNYNITCDSINSKDGEEKENNKVTSYCYKGIKISLLESIKIEGTDSKRIKYQVSTGATWNLGSLNKILALGGKQQNSKPSITGTWTISGEATVVARG